MKKVADREEVAQRSDSKGLDWQPSPTPGVDSLGFFGRLANQCADRFWSKVDRRGPDDCWPWKSSATGMGYGRIKIGGKVYSAHRVAYALTNGDIPSGAGFHGTVVRHTCDNKRCCNPAHLIAGSQAANVADMSARSRGRSNVLTAADAAAIRQDQRPQKAIAADYGVAESTVWKIRVGRLWKTVSEIKSGKRRAEA